MICVIGNRQHAEHQKYSSGSSCVVLTCFSCLVSVIDWYLGRFMTKKYCITFEHSSNLLWLLPHFASNISTKHLPVTLFTAICSEGNTEKFVREKKGTKSCNLWSPSEKLVEASQWATAHFVILSSCDISLTYPQLYVQIETHNKKKQVQIC